jgi:Concanavalin A-like lectin/glucanases superfamily
LFALWIRKEKSETSTFCQQPQTLCAPLLGSITDVKPRTNPKKSPAHLLFFSTFGGRLSTISASSLTRFCRCFRDDALIGMEGSHKSRLMNVTTMNMFRFNQAVAVFRRIALCPLALLASCFLPAAHAGLTFTVDFYVANGTYVFYTPMVTNSTGTNAIFGTYRIYSPGQPTNGSWRQFTYDTNGFNTTDGSETRYNDLPTAVHDLTNGTWTLQIVNTNNVTNSYQFIVNVPGGLSSNQIPITTITFPTNNADNVTNFPTFTWTGQPTNWPVVGTAYVIQDSGGGVTPYDAQTAILATQSNWTLPGPMPANLTNTTAFFSLDYVTNYTGNLFIASVPSNATNMRSISGWEFNSILESGGGIIFTVPAPPNTSTNHTLVAHYAFDNGGFLGLDASANGNDILCSSGWGGNQQQIFITNSVAGGGAIEFFGESSLTPCGGSQQFDNWTNALAGSFTVSAWINTTNTSGNDSDFLYDYDGQNVIYQNNNANGINPLGITGTKAAFETGVAPGVYGGDTLHSTNSVTTGSYVHVVVTRDQGSGLKQIYINGALDSWDYGVPGILTDADYDSIGGESSGPYIGDLDDVQIYSGVLDAYEIANLYTNPGTTAPDGPQESPSSVLGNAVNAPNLPWATYGDTSWYVETTNTYDGVAAVESGSVQDNQSTTLQTTIVGPGTVTFWWQCLDYSLEGNNYEVDFNTNGVFVDNLTPDAYWTQGTYPIAPGTNVLTWTAYAYGDEDPTEVSFLDEFTFTSSAPSSITMQNPRLSGTNFQFQFQTQSGHTHYVLSTTNLVTGPWVTNRTITGDGSVQLIAVPCNSPQQQFFQISTQ